MKPRLRSHANGHKRHRRRSKRRKIHSMVLAGATTLFAPHTGKVLPKAGAGGTLSASALASGAYRDLPIPLVTTSTEFRLPADLAYEDIIQTAARHFKVSADLVRAVIRVESGFDPNAVSIAGAQGLMQLMPALSKELGVRDPFDPVDNVMGGTRYLAYLLDLHHGDLELALASYNAGPGAVELYNGVPPFPETQHYVKAITGLLVP